MEKLGRKDEKERAVKRKNDNGWEGWGGYMKEKGRKLEEQFQGLNENSRKEEGRSSIFKGVCIFVNGYTNPSSDHLKQIMAGHGGRFQHYYSKRVCTHIIATNLPDSKIKELKNEKVCHPDWITDSVKAGKCLSVEKYLLYNRPNFKHKHMFASFTPKPPNKPPGKLPLVKPIDQTRADFQIDERETDWNSLDFGGLQDHPVYSGSCEKTSAESALSSPDLFSDDGQNSNADDTSRKEFSYDVCSLNLDSSSVDTTNSNDSASVSPASFSDGNSMDATDVTDPVLSKGGVASGLNLGYPNSDISKSYSAYFGDQASFPDDNSGDATDVPASVLSNDGFASGSNQGLPCSEINKSYLGSFEDQAAFAVISSSKSSDMTAPALTKHDYAGSPNSKPLSKAGDPGFMNEFYSNSRLHHLSMWRSELKRYASMISSASKKLKKQAGCQSERYIMHVDMDSFFVSVTLKERPDLQGKPVAVCHASKGTNSAGVSSMSEIASCSYEARDRGVRNGMFLGQAKTLCPEIICVPYKFESYRVVSQQFYEILASYTNEIEAVSCDEALLDISDLITEDSSALDIARQMRENIFNATGCKASAGIASNILLARMATRKAKPNGQFQLARDDIKEFIGPQKVTNLPGVGRSLAHKLNEMGVTTCAELRSISLSKLQDKFGPKTGLTLHKHCRGLDDRAIKTEHERQSVSAEINYGIRFVEDREAFSFIGELAKEVNDRLKAIQMKGTHITLKIMVRKKEAPEPRKHMGHGICDNISKSTLLSSATDDTAVITKECANLLKNLRVSSSDIRGMGIQVSKLIRADSKGIRTIDFSNCIKARPAIATATVKSKSDADVMKSASNNSSVKGINTIDLSNCIKARPTMASSSVTSISGASNSATNNAIYTSPSKKSCLGRGKSSDTNFSRQLRNKGKKKVSPRKKQVKNPSATIESFMKTTSSNTQFRPNFETQSKDPPLPSLFSSPDKPNVSAPPVELGLPSPSQVDPTVFNALPADIRWSITESYRAKNQTLNVGSNRIEVASNRIGLGSNIESREPDVALSGLTKTRERFVDEKARDKWTSIASSDIDVYPSIDQPVMAFGSRHHSVTETTASGSRDIETSVEASYSSLAQIDASVMNELPEELRREILLNIKFEERRKKKELQKKLIDGREEASKVNSVSGCSKSNTVSDAKRQDQTGEELRYDEDRVVELDDQSDQLDGNGNIEVNGDESNSGNARDKILHRPMLCGKNDYKDVKELIKRWVESSKEPYVEDIEEITKYLEDLISYRNMEQAFLLMKYIHRVTREFTAWTVVVNDIEQKVQQLVQGLYGGKFPLGFIK